MAERTDVVLTEWDRLCMAYHEAGHAVCSYFLPEREKLISITIDPSDEAFGMVRTEARPHHNETEVSFMSAIATFLAGRLAEEMCLGIKSSSGIHDLATARELAKSMVCCFGMGKRIGLLSVVDVTDCSFQLYGERIKDEIDEDIREILERGKSLAEQILLRHKTTVERLAHVLLANKSLKHEEIHRFFNSPA